MDAFFASVEQRDNPSLRGKPIAVGFDGPRGVVSTASYEARRFGVHSAMSVSKAKILCPGLIIVPSDHYKYKKVSDKVHEIFRRYTDLIEPLSIDEAFLDITDCKTGDTDAVIVAGKIRREIHDELNITASAGISYNKFLAKIASDCNKPDGMFVVTEAESDDFISRLPIERFWGVGPKTARIMHKIGIFNGMQLRQCSLSHLIEIFGKAGQQYYDFARGKDTRPVEPVRIRKSVGCEQTFFEDISRKSSVLIELYHIVLELVSRLSNSGFSGTTLTLKVKFRDFTQITRSVTCGKHFKSKDDILPVAKSLMAQVDYLSHPIRLIGLSVSNPQDEIRRKEWVEGTLDFKDWDRE